MLILTGLLFALLFFLQSTTTANDKNLGVNLTNTGAFVSIINHTNRYINVESFDEYGWPNSDFELVIMDHRPVKEWSNETDDPEEYRIDYSGRYKSSFKGEADIEIKWSNTKIENKIYDQNTNTTYFDLVIPGPPAKGHAFIYAIFTNTRKIPGAKLNSGISELKIMRPGYEMDTKKIFTDEYIDLCKAADFACYRYYTLQNIWDGEPVFPKTTKWDNRKTPQDATQLNMKNMNRKLDGWCWEYIIELANILKKDIWINIHLSCDTNYIINLAEMLKNNLDPSINIYVENSNEVWSPTFKTNGAYNQAQAEHYGITFNQNYARRSVELSGLFAEVFGKNEINKRIRVVLAGQQAYNGRSDQHLNYINNTFGLPKEFIYATSTALYFGSSNPTGSVEEINTGMLNEINKQINDSENNLYRLNHINKAKKWDLSGGCTSYEGGPALPAAGKISNLDNQISAHRTETMKDIIITNYENGWFNIGGGLAMYFSLFSAYNRYGCWGLTDDFNKADRNYKMKGIQELIGIWGNVDNDKINYHRDISIFPNPIKSIATIKINYQKSEYAQISLYDNLGGRVKQIANGIMQKGIHTVSIETESMYSGVYYLKVLSPSHIGVYKILVFK